MRQPGMEGATAPQSQQLAAIFILKLLAVDLCLTKNDWMSVRILVISTSGASARSVYWYGPSWAS
jgi:hypothetical protein